jgi:hypothetical protein
MIFIDLAIQLLSEKARIIDWAPFGFQAAIGFWPRALSAKHFVS